MEQLRQDPPIDTLSTSALVIYTPDFLLAVGAPKERMYCINVGHNKWKLCLYTFVAFTFKKEAVLLTWLKLYQINSVSTIMHEAKRPNVTKAQALKLLSRHSPLSGGLA